MTIIKTSNDVNKLQQSQKTYEMEIDYSNTNNNADKLKVILKELEEIKKVMLETDNLVKKKDEENIIINYKNLVYGSNNLNFNNLYSMHPSQLKFSILLILYQINMQYQINQTEINMLCLLIMIKYILYQII